MYHQFDTCIAWLDRQCADEPPVSLPGPAFPRNLGTDISLTWSEAGELFLVASVATPLEARRAAADAYVQIAETIRKHRLAIVHERIFASLSAGRGEEERLDRHQHEE